MPSINIDLDFFTNPKVVRLTGRLGAGAAQNLIRLWCHVGKHYPDTGGATDWTADEVEAASVWTGEKGALFECLMLLKLIHPWFDGYRIHDWEEHAGHLKRYREKAKSAAKARWNKKNDAPSNAPGMPQAMLKCATSNAPSNANTIQDNTKQISLSSRAEVFSDVLLNLSREVYGLTPEVILTGWITVQKWPEAWIVEATQISAEAGKRGKAAVQYSAGIMRGWTRDGKPDRNDAKNHGLPTGKRGVSGSGKFAGRDNWANKSNGADGCAV